MGCIVPQGSHRVVFRYAPASFPVGCAISAATLLGLGIAAVFGWRSRGGQPPERKSVSSRSEKTACSAGSPDRQCWSGSVVERSCRPACRLDGDGLPDAYG